VKWIDRVLEVALESMPQPLPDEEAVAAPAEPVAAPKIDPTGEVRAHCVLAYNGGLPRE
jgi:ATP-dependent Lon protease